MSQLFKLYDVNYNFLSDFVENISTFEKEKILTSFQNYLSTSFQNSPKYFAVGNHGDIIVYDTQTNDIRQFTDSG